MASHASVIAMVESTRQRLGFRRDKTFVATPNVRNPQMLQEAEAFSEQLGAFERAVKDYHKHAQGFLRSLVPLMECNLPRVWTLVEGGLAEPVRPAISHGHPTRIGGDYNAGLLLDQLDLLQRGIDEQVLAPLRRWQEGLAVARERMSALDRLRAEVDSQRRKAQKKFSNAEIKIRKAYLGAGYGSSSSSDEAEDKIVPRGRLLEDYQRLALHTERQLNAITSSYGDHERLVWEQLSGLVTDAAWLESYAAATMVKVKEALQGVAVALGPSKQPLPAYRGSGYSQTSSAGYGEVGDNMALITQMSPRALELAHGAIPRGAAVLPYQPMRAKRGLATPLMVAASASPGAAQRHLALQPVPPVALGAAGVPLNAVPESIRESAIRDVEHTAAGEGVSVADAAALPSALDPSVFSPTRAAEHGLSPPTSTLPPAPRSTAGSAATTPTSMSGGVGRRERERERVPLPPGASGLQGFGSDVVLDGSTGTGTGFSGGAISGSRGGAVRAIPVEQQEQLRVTRIGGEGGGLSGSSLPPPYAGTGPAAAAAPMGVITGGGNNNYSSYGSNSRGLGESREGLAGGFDRAAGAAAPLMGGGDASRSERLAPSGSAFAAEDVRAGGGDASRSSIQALAGGRSAAEPASASPVELNGVSGAAGGSGLGGTAGETSGVGTGRSDDVLDSFATSLKAVGPVPGGAGGVAAGGFGSATAGDAVRPSSTGGYSSSQSSPPRSLAAAIRAELRSGGGDAWSPPPPAAAASPAAGGLARVNSLKLTGPVQVGSSAGNSEAGDVEREEFRDATSQVGDGSSASSYLSDFGEGLTTTTSGAAASSAGQAAPGRRFAAPGAASGGAAGGVEAPYSPTLGAARGQQPEVLKGQQQLQQVKDRLAGASY